MEPAGLRGPHQMLGIREGRGPVEAMSYLLSSQGPGGDMMGG
jgi:hypothetical protein